MTDMERLTTRIVYGTANCRDLRALWSALSIIPDLQNMVSFTKSALLQEVFKGLDPLSDIRDLIEHMYIYVG